MLYALCSIAPCFIHTTQFNGIIYFIIISEGEYLINTIDNIVLTVYSKCKWLVVSSIFCSQHCSHKPTKYHPEQASHWSISNAHGTQKPMHHTNYVFDNFIFFPLSIEHCAAQPVHKISVISSTFLQILTVQCCMLIHILTSIHSFLFLSLTNHVKY